MRLATGIAALAIIGAAGTAFADTVPQALPFSQDWTNIGLITVNDDWSGVPGITGYRGDDAVAGTGVNPQTIVAPYDAVVDVNANQLTPNTFTTGGVTEFHIANPAVALAGSGTADFPHLVIFVSTLARQSITFSCRLIDLEDGTDNAVQQVAVQYRVGNAGNYTDLPSAYVADATAGPSLGGLVTPVSVILPAACDNQPEVQIRVMTSNAVGNDEWVAVDDISVTGDSLPVPTEPTTWGAIKGGASTVNQ